MLFTSLGGIEEQINYMFQISHLPLTIYLSDFLAIVFHKVLQSANCILVYLQNEKCCLLYSSYFWKIQMNKSWYKWKWLLLLMESRMQSKPKWNIADLHEQLVVFGRLQHDCTLQALLTPEKSLSLLARSLCCLKDFYNSGRFLQKLTHCSAYLPLPFSSPLSLAHCACFLITVVTIPQKAI